MEKQEISGERFGVLLLARDTPHVEAADSIFVPSAASRYEKERKKGEEEMDRLESQERLNRSECGYAAGNSLTLIGVSIARVGALLIYSNCYFDNAPLPQLLHSHYRTREIQSHSS